MSEQIGIFNLIKENSYTLDKCFLCGCNLTHENKSVEHVIPKWLQNQFNLWDQTISLLNGTTFPYRSLVIPCCKKCNNGHLKSIEDKVKAAFDGGYEEFQKLDKETLFLWLGKIYFGLMYRELFLNFNTKNHNEGKITTPEYLKTFDSHFIFLQGIRKLHTFKDFFPSSIHIFKTLKTPYIEGQWDLVDNNKFPFIAIRMGEIGIISSLQDCGTIQQFDNQLNHHKNISLDRTQFREMVAKILYKTTLMNRTPKFHHFEDRESVETFLQPLQGANSKPIFDNWNNDIYSQYLSFYTNKPLEVCQPEKGKAYTFIADNNNYSLWLPMKDFS